MLQNFEEIDPKYLEIIVYTQKLMDTQQEGKDFAGDSFTNKTALHLAIKEGNKKCADILLKFMSKINYNSSKNFKDLFDQLVEFQSFQSYLAQLPN